MKKLSFLFILVTCISLPGCSIKEQLCALGESLKQLSIATESPAKKQLMNFLGTNTDSKKFELFIKNNFKDPKDWDFLLDFQESTGGFTLKKITNITPFVVTALVEEVFSEALAECILTVDAQAPHLITDVSIKKTHLKNATMSEPELIVALKKHLDTLVQKGKFSGSVLIAKNGAPIFKEAYGFAEREKQIPNTIDTKFNLGSMNKMFTAVAIAQLVEAGKLQFSDTIEKILPDYPNAGVKKVTVHQLLTHHGGTGDIFGPEFEKNLTSLKTPSDYITLYGNRDVDFTPGSEFRYSNYGFVLLGAIIEKVSGQNYYEYIRDHIYKPAHMINSDSYFKTEHVPNMAIGYLSLDSQNLKTNYDTLPMRGSPAGGGYSTVEDLLQFARALQNHTLLNKEYTELVTTGKVAMGPDKDAPSYAYGFIDIVINGTHCFGHAGGAPGINSDLKICQNGYTVIVMDNTGKNASALSEWIMDRLPK